MTHMIPTWLDGVLTPVEKLEVHRKGFKHKAVSVFVMNKGRVLIQQRAMCKYHTPGLWANTCCTHPHWGEDPADCAMRRLREELGITGLYPAMRDTVEYRADVGGGMIEHEVVDIFTADAPDTLRFTPNPEEVMATDWVDLHSLTAQVNRHPDRYTAWLKIYLNQYRERIFLTSHVGE
ncbi:MAG: isopentenyl-diphosphate Delta-isomerase [Pseudomonadota bacterium]